MSNARISIVPAIIENGLVKIKSADKPFFNEVYEFKNTDELSNFIVELREKYLKSESSSAKIFVSPIGRKVRGFDQWKKINLGLFEIKI